MGLKNMPESWEVVVKDFKLGEMRLGEAEKFSKKIESTLIDGDTELLPDDITSWERLFRLMKRKHGHYGTWACFELLRERHHVHLLLQDDGSLLRDDVINAATEKDTRMETILHVALRLRSFSQEWPDLYAKVIHSFLKKELYDQAVKWHLRLSRYFPPGPDVMGGLISAFIFDLRPEMQQALTSIYIFSAERSLYDRLIPVLFDHGIAWLARAWRKTMVKVGDKPSSSGSWPYLNFLDRFGAILGPEEVEVLRGTRHSNMEDGPRATSRLQRARMRGIYHDDFVAKWLASSWLSVDFAINLMRKFGVSMIGTRSLQALALREPDARSVAIRIAQLERLGVRVSQQIYCKVLASFARNDEDKLLDLLLHTDIHPDEFDDPDTREIIMDDAIKSRDRKREELFRGIERALEYDESPRRLNELLRNILKTRPLGKARVIVDRMDALKVTMTQENAALLLDRTFAGVSKHPTRWSRGVRQSGPDELLDRAIDVTRRISKHKVAIPMRYWEILLYALGRHGRLEELLQLSLEIMDIYNPPGGGLVPVYRNDMPPSQAMKKTSREGQQSNWSKSLEGEASLEHQIMRRSMSTRHLEDTQYIPGDFRLGHHAHPIRTLFTSRLQRSIIRWGFDQTLSAEPQTSLSTSKSVKRLSDYDIACGVRILAVLRDRGLPVDPRSVRSSIYVRIILGEVPKRRHRSRDAQHVAVHHVKSLVESAWAGEKPVLPPVFAVSREVEKRRPEVWRRYTILFGSTYRRGALDAEAEAWEQEEERLLQST